MHRSLWHRAASRSVHPNPKLYVALIGNVTWRRWQSHRSSIGLFQQIEEVAMSIAAGIPNRSNSGYRKKIDSLLESSEVNQLLSLFRQLPDELRPIPPMTGPRVLAFCLNLSGRMLRSTRP